MEFSCSICEYTSDQRSNILRHINKRNKCGEDPQIIEKKVEIRCEHCNKMFSTRPSLKRHYKTCKKIHNQVIKERDRRIAELEAQLEKERAKPKTVNVYNTQINLNGYRQTSLEHLTDQHYQRAVGRMIYSVPQMIENVHFNKSAPENHNIFISNIKGKYVMVYDGEKWCSKPQDQVIDQLINDQEYAIEDWLGEGENFPKEMRKFNEYLEKKEQHDDVKDIIREEVKLLLYNNREKVKR